MILTLVLALIILTIVYATWTNSKKDAIVAAVFTGSIGVIICIAISGASYATYLDIRAQYDATINQYKGAVTMYADYADLDVKKATLTDFKHSGYQENMAKSITSLRRQVVWYNEVLIKKKILDENPLFSWLIIGPDEDMKIINIVE